MKRCMTAEARPTTTETITPLDADDIATLRRIHDGLEAADDGDWDRQKRLTRDSFVYRESGGAGCEEWFVVKLTEDGRLALARWRSAVAA